MPSCFSMPPMRCSRPGVPGTAHGRASVCGSRRYGQNTSVPSASRVVRRRWRTATRRSGSSSTSGIAPRLGAVGQVAVGEQEDRGAVGQRDPGRLQRGVEAVRRACAGPRSAPGPRRCARTSPGAGRPARSWSADRSTGRRAGCRRPAAAVPARPRGRSSPTSARRRDRRWWSPPSAPPNAAPSAAPMPAISSSAWKVRTPKFLCLRQLVQDVGGRGDRVRAEEQRQLGLLRRRRSARSDSARLPEMLRYVPAGKADGRRRDLVGDREVLGGLAEVPARAERRDVRLGDLAASWRTWSAGSVSVPSVGRWYIHDSRPEREHVLRRARPPCGRARSPSSASTVSVVSGTGWTR